MSESSSDELLESAAKPPLDSNASPSSANIRGCCERLLPARYIPLESHLAPSPLLPLVRFLAGDWYLCSLPASAAFIAGARAGASQSISSLIICRFLAGLFASPRLSIGSSRVADMLPGTSYAIPLVVHLAILARSHYWVSPSP